ncbi:type II toxin-antitoxin system RelB family antitoxin [Streptococcus massiliensis]|uniref:CopG family transcriptional regulator n=1 Tax=Streptococcus massiliensis TaxID=313439 RepID=A0A380L1M5_9STRE|nr:DUF6290 family protein [Streptococcus massiliensis]SUN77136.1 Uncharacterised protein [Streptococcus massiliensis]
MATMTVRMNNEDSELIRNYINMHGLTISEFARQSMLERIEDEYDLEILRKATAEDESSRCSMPEVAKELRFDL